MDREIHLRHLAMSERHIAEGNRHLAAQEALIARMDQLGQSTTEALRVLATLRETQALHIQHRDHILDELSRL